MHRHPIFSGSSQAKLMLHNNDKKSKIGTNIIQDSRCELTGTDGDATRRTTDPIIALSLSKVSGLVPTVRWLPVLPAPHRIFCSPLYYRTRNLQTVIVWNFPAHNSKLNFYIYFSFKLN